MIKLLIDSHIFADGFSGMRSYIEGLYRQMISHKDIVFYFASYDNTEMGKIFGFHSNVKYIEYSCKNKFFRLAYEIPYLIRKHEIDYAHFQYISPLIKHCKEIVTIHDLLFLDFPQYFPLIYRLKNTLLFKRSARRADILLSVSEYSKQEIIRHFHIPESKITITPNCVEPKISSLDFNALREKLCIDKYILSVSRIEPRKNHLSLLRAFVEMDLYEQGYSLVFVGRYDWSNKEFDNYYKSLPDKTRGKVVICTLTNEELISLYQHAALSVFPSFAEGFGIPPIEAITAGCPLLCSNATAMSEFHLPEQFLFDPYDIDELKQKIAYMLTNKPDVSSLKDEIVKRYDWQNSANALYCKIVGNYSSYNKD